MGSSAVASSPRLRWRAIGGNGRRARPPGGRGPRGHVPRAEDDFGILPRVALRDGSSRTVAYSAGGEPE